MKHIFDASFEYTRSADTDLRKTFQRLRREQQERRLGAPAAPGNAGELRLEKGPGAPCSGPFVD